ncbi:hypothetical protein GCM10025780_28460 [Frondihabitans cladoniiphilus]|uniref:Uncharacterized protein n=1 Tax=Frondihabitans cladoniiphilus TaxID=715785 RepID=A0ABP8W5E0_9MICO
MPELPTGRGPNCGGGGWGGPSVPSEGRRSRGSATQATGHGSSPRKACRGGRAAACLSCRRSTGQSRRPCPAHTGPAPYRPTGTTRRAPATAPTQENPAAPFTLNQKTPNDRTLNLETFITRKGPDD